MIASVFLLTALLLQSAADSAGLMTPGISRQLATRRTSELGDVHYALSLDLTRLDTAHGHVHVAFVVERPGDVILDFRGPTLSDVAVNNATILRLDWNKAHLRIPARLLTRGRNTVEASFATMIAPAGWPIIRYHDDTDRRDYLYTLLVPSDANALFPCFDQPDLKARLTLQLTVPRAWTAIANG